MAIVKNLASGTLAEPASVSSTTLFVYVGEVSASEVRGLWPNVPFYVSIMPPNPVAGVPNSLDSEIALVTAVSNDQVGNAMLTVTRGQRGTTAKAFATGSVVTNAVYADDAVLLGDEGASETPTPWIDANDIIWSSVMDRIYPVGSYYETSDETFDPNTAWGGTWVEDTAGRVLVANDTGTFATVGDEGGSETHTNVLNSNGHALLNIKGNGDIVYRENSMPRWTGNYSATTGGSAAGGSYADQVYGAELNGSTGNGSSLQPYIVVKRWHRTA